MALIEINKNPSRRELGWFGAMFAAFFVVVGSILLWKFEARTAACAVWIAAGCVTFIYYAIPPIRRSVFLAWLYSVSLAASGVGGAVLATFIVSFTVASVPGGRVLSMVPALGTVGIPIDGLAVLLGVDRVPDMARTATNVTGTLTATVVVDRIEQRLETRHK